MTTLPASNAIVVDGAHSNRRRDETASLIAKSTSDQTPGFDEGSMATVRKAGSVGSRLGPLVAGAVLISSLTAPIFKESTAGRDASSSYADHFQAAPVLQDLWRRINYLAALEPGWLDGDGDAMARDVVGFLMAAVPRLATLALPRVRIYPTESGGAQIAWVSEDDVSVSVEIEADMSAFGRRVSHGSGERITQHFEEISLTALVGFLLRR